MTTITIKTLALVLAALAPGAVAQTIVQTGDDLTAVVAAASSGDVIEIHSDAVFPVALDLGAGGPKDLELRAGSGFSPVLEGSGAPAVTVTGGGQTLRFEGLRLTQTSGGTDQGLFAAGGSGGLGPLVLELTDCELPGGASVFHPLAGSTTLRIAESEVGGHGLTAAASGTAALVVELDATELASVSVVGALTSQSLVTVSVRDCLVQGVTGLASAGSLLDVNLRRTRFLDTVAVGAADVATGGSVQLLSCLVTGSGQPGSIGVQVTQPSGGHALPTFLTSCTVTGFDTGLELPTGTGFGAGTIVQNCVLAGNTDDVVGSVLPTTFSWSLVEDGDADPLVGNLVGPAQFDADFGLVPGSPGVDTGSSLTALPIGPLDVYGNPREVDMDCDGTATVNMGAVEAPPSLLASVTSKPLGNPDELTITTPHVGQVATATIPMGPDGVLAFLAIAPPSLPFQVPGWKGNVLVQPGPGLQLWAGLGTFPLPIPNDCALVGAPVSVQGVRVEGASLTVQLLNRLDLTLGH